MILVFSFNSSPITIFKSFHPSFPLMFPSKLLPSLRLWASSHRFPVFTHPTLHPTPSRRFVTLNMASQEDLKKRLSPLEYEVTQHAATEAPFTGQYDKFFEEGLYVDIVNGEALFTSLDKFDSGCGWPAFSKPIGFDRITQHADFSIANRPRVEVKSKEANSHLGHVFDDGPKELGGRRYCINSAALKFIPVSELETAGYGQYVPLFKKAE